MGQKTRKYLFYFGLLFLCVPFMQQSLEIVKVKPINGFLPPSPDATFNIENWWNEQYQPEKTSYLNEHFGFRPALLRFNNQIDYSIFNRVNSDWLVLSKGNCLFFQNELADRAGLLFPGEDSLRKKMMMVKAIQDTFAKMGKLMFIVYAPVKPAFYPEFIREDSLPAITGRTNVDRYKRLGKLMGINQVDIGAWFYAMKNTRKELLFPKQGFHWSMYGSLLAEDSIIKYIELQKQIVMPKPVLSNLIRTRIPRGSDDDARKLMNVMAQQGDEVYTYADVHYPRDSSLVKTYIMYIGDIYLLELLTNKMMDSCNSSWVIWWNSQYISNIADPNDKSPKGMKTYDWIAGTKNMDCVVLLYTSWDLPRLGDGFVEKAYSYYYPKKD